MPRDTLIPKFDVLVPGFACRYQAWQAPTAPRTRYSRDMLTHETGCHGNMLEQRLVPTCIHGPLNALPLAALEHGGGDRLHYSHNLECCQNLSAFQLALPREL
jgi:hypothetical protein